ncbi:MAG: hypothetical protein HYS12_19010 [Planctomycetes bacterium]|nr:hypothetical protein [Planctomycetota bacterium]
MRAWLVQTVAPLALAAFVVAGVVVLGGAAANDLRQHERYSLAFEEVRCESPPGVCREEFLREVQYEAELPDHLDRFDALAPRLRAAFLRHPWVESVERIEVSPTGSVRVWLTHRTPVLSIPGPGPARVLDHDGVLLPRAADSAGLPVFRGKVAGAAGPTGTPWGDPAVVAAARTAGFLRPQGERLGLEAFEVVRGEVVLWTSSGSRILWGNAPGREGAGEATAVLKRDRLLNQLARLAGNEGPGAACEHDLRPATGSTQQTLSEVVQVGSRGQP